MDSYRFFGRRPCQPTELRVSQPESANRKARGSQQEGASQPTGRRESANRKARVSEPGRRESGNQEGASQATRKARVSQPGCESANQVARQPTRSRVSQPGRESANQVASQPTRSRVSQPGRESANQVGSQSTRSRVRQPGPWGRGWETFVRHRHMQVQSLFEPVLTLFSESSLVTCQRWHI